MFDGIFVVGTGRSGTHFVCRSLRGFANAYDPLNGNESTPLLKEIAQAAIAHQSFPQFARNYYLKVNKSRDRASIFIDQHHPNLFFCGELLNIFEKPIFLFPNRPIIQIVASMLNHKGVMAWYEYARRESLPFPNRFLGLNDISQIESEKLNEVCTRRVLAHFAMAKEMQDSGVDLRLINYENLVRNQADEFAKVFSSSELAALGNFTVKEESENSSLTKYRETLSESDIADIQRLINEVASWPT
jgi:hypothetical protein